MRVTHYLFTQWDDLLYTNNSTSLYECVQWNGKKRKKESQQLAYDLKRELSQGGGILCKWNMSHTCKWNLMIHLTFKNKWLKTHMGGWQQESFNSKTNRNFSWKKKWDLFRPTFFRQWLPCIDFDLSNPKVYSVLNSPDKVCPLQLALCMIWWHIRGNWVSG